MEADKTHIKNTEKRRIRFPVEMKRQVVRICRKQKCTFSSFVRWAVKEALSEIHKN